jgi:prevent-host-death family protein
MSSITVGVREAKLSLSKLLKQVRKGKRVIITDRGEPIGRIVPIDKEELSVEDLLKSLEERGIVQQQGKKGMKIPRPARISRKISLQSMLQEDRGRS